MMEVHSGQHSATMAQAMAHNTATIIGDLDMLERLLSARGEHEVIRQVERAHEQLRAAYAGLLSVYGDRVALEVADGAGHVHVHGNERSLVEAERHDAQLARRYETR